MAHSIGKTIAELRKAKGWTQVELAEKLGFLKDSAENMHNTLNQPLSIGQTITATTQAISGLVMAANSLSSIWTILEDPDTYGFEKVLSIIMTLGTAIPGVISAQSALAKVTQKSSAAAGVQATATTGQNAADTAHTVTLWGKVAAMMSNPWLLAVTVAAFAVAIAVTNNELTSASLNEFD